MLEFYFWTTEIVAQICTTQGDIMKIFLTLVCALSLSACGSQLTSQQDVSRQPRPGPAVCPDCAWGNFAMGTTWTVLGQQVNPRGENIIVVGADAQTDPILGDTHLSVDLPILCLEPLPAPIQVIISNQNNLQTIEINARVAISATASGLQARSLDTSDDICQQQFRGGWRMAHDTDAPDLNVLVALGQIAPRTRFWVAIDPKHTNPMP
jgi:hypothetical protein